MDSSPDSHGWVIRGTDHVGTKVVLYFNDHADALRFALAACQVMAGEGGKFTNDLIPEPARVTRIRLDRANAVRVKTPNPHLRGVTGRPVEILEYDVGFQPRAMSGIKVATA